MSEASEREAFEEWCLRDDPVVTATMTRDEIGQPLPAPPSRDSGECRSCVDGKCVTGAECVTLGRDDDPPKPGDERPDVNRWVLP